MLLPPPGVHYATRHACSAASAERAEAAEGLAALASADAAMGDAGVSADPALEDPPPSLPKLTTTELAAAETAVSRAAAGAATLRQQGVSSALRSALHMVGDIETPLSAEHKHQLAERFIHTRIAVDSHTAGALLLEAYSQSHVFILRDFPGALPPLHSTIAPLLRSPPASECLAYSFNDHRSRVHYVFTSLADQSAQTQAALE